MFLTLVGWNTFAATYVLTSRTFAGVDSDEFRRRMAQRSTRRPWVWRVLLRGGDGPSFTLESTVVAFAVVLVLPHVRGIEIDDWLLVPLSTTILLSCWGLGVYAYALHYAQHDLATPALQFPGDRTSAFADHLYFSIAVSTTFGTTDIDIISPEMRRVVNFHTVLTFVYNSVIVALLVSLLVR